MLNYTIYKAIILPHPKYCLKTVKTNIFKFWSFAYKNRQKKLWLLLPDKICVESSSYIQLSILWGIK